MGIDIDVELRRRRDIAALAHGPAHQHDLLNLRRDARLFDEGGGDIGERAGGHERDRIIGRCHQRLDDEIDGVLRLQRMGRIVDIEPVDARAPVHVLRGDQCAHQRARATGEDLHIGAPAELAHEARVAFRQRQRHVAGYRGDAKNFQFAGRSKREQQHDRIVLARVAINQNRPRRHSLRLSSVGPCLSIAPATRARRAIGFVPRTKRRSRCARAWTAPCRGG